MLSRSSIKREEGQAATELALVAPALLLILFAVLQFGIVFKDYLALTDAVRAGGRMATVSRQKADPVGETKNAVKRAAPDLRAADLQINVTSSWDRASEVTVEGTYPYRISILGMVVKSGRISSVTRERVE